jgi:alpha-1,2-mannosyltransferase
MIVAAWMCGALFDDRKDEASASPLFSRRTLIAAGAVLVLIRFVLDNFNMGQVNTFVTMFAVAHVYLFAKKRKLAAAFALGIAVALKLTPGLLIVYHLARRRWAYAALCSAITAVVMAASFLPFGTRAPQVFSVFMNRTVKNQQGFNLAYSGNQSLRATLARAAGGPTESMEQMDATARQPTTVISMVAAAILLVLAVIAAALARSPAAAAPFFACYVLISPLSWKAHFVALILPVAYLIGQMLTLNDARWRRAIAVLLGAAFLLFTFTSHRLIGRVAADWADSHSLICLTALLVFFATVSVMLRPRASRKPGLIIGDETA